MNDLAALMRDAASSASPSVPDIVDGAVARGARRVRRRHLLTGLGSVAAVGVVATGAALLPGVGGSPATVDGSGFAAEPSASASADGQAPVTREQQLLAMDQALRGRASGRTYSPPGAPAQVVPDVPLALHDDAIHAQLASMLPAGEVGPILTAEQSKGEYAPSDEGTTERGLFFTYDGTETMFSALPAREGGCEVWLAAVGTDRSRSYGECQVDGDVTTVTEEYTQLGGRFRTVVAWSHGYQLFFSSSNVAPVGPDFYPAPNDKKREVVAEQPPLDVATLTAVVTSDVWFG